MEFLILLIVIIIIGALLGGKSFGGTIRKGCGFLLLFILAITVGIFFYSQYGSKKKSENQEVISTGENSAHFIVKENCQTYIKPNLESDTSGNLEVGKELFVEDINKFNYFYELTNDNEKKTFVKKECLQRINFQ